MNPPPYAQLAAFVAIARHGSFSRAANVLGVSASALSQSMRALESVLGVRLLNRTTRRVGLTEEGQRLLAQVQPALAGLDAALEASSARRGQPVGRLRITASRVAIGLLLEPRLAEFAARYPAIELELDAEDRLSDLIAGDFDAGIRLGETLAQGVVALPVGSPLQLVVVASPDYLRRHPAPITPHQLSAHACICFRYPGSQRIMPWPFSAPDGREFEIEVDGPLICNDNRYSRSAALQGAGLSMQFACTVQDALDDGRLQRALADWQPPAEQLHVYYSTRRHLPEKLRVFVDFLREQPHPPAAIMPR